MSENMSTAEKKIDINSLCYQIIQKAKDVRLKLGCSQADFAKKTGVAKSLIEGYERGIYYIQPETLERMVKKLPYDIEIFFPESPEEFYINSEDKKAFNLVQTLKRIKDLKVRDTVCALTRLLSEGIQISKVTTEIRPVNYQMARKAKDWRLARGCTQIELADKIGTSDQQIYRYELGKVSFKKLPQMAEGLSVSSGVLLPTSKEESYCEDESSEGEKKILSIMKEYQKIDNQKLKDLWYSFLTEVVRVGEEGEKQ